MNVDDVDWKYLEESYPLAWNMTKRLRTGQEVVSATVTVEDSRGVDVTTQIIETTVAVVHPRVFVTFKANGGTRGKKYIVKVLAATTDGDLIEQKLELEIR